MRVNVTQIRVSGSFRAEERNVARIKMHPNRCPLWRRAGNHPCAATVARRLVDDSVMHLNSAFTRYEHGGLTLGLLLCWRNEQMNRGSSAGMSSDNLYHFVGGTLNATQLGACPGDSAAQII